MMNHDQFDEMVISEGYREEMLKFIGIYHNNLPFEECVKQITDYVRSLNLSDEENQHLIKLFATEVDDPNTLNYVLENFGYPTYDIINFDSIAPYEGLDMK